MKGRKIWKVRNSFLRTLSGMYGHGGVEGEYGEEMEEDMEHNDGQNALVTTQFARLTYRLESAVGYRVQQGH